MNNSPQHNFDYASYLASKEDLDGRSINRNVWDAFVAYLAGFSGDTIKLLEVGAGIGATFKRIVSLGLHVNMEYTLLDNEAQNLSFFSSQVILRGYFAFGSSLVALYFPAGILGRSVSSGRI